MLPQTLLLAVAQVVGREFKIAIWVSSVRRWSWNTMTPNSSMPFSISAACSRVSGWVMSIPEATPPKKGRETGSIGRMDSVMADLPQGRVVTTSSDKRSVRSRGQPVNFGPPGGSRLPCL
jgi:hypothetical protein